MQAVSRLILNSLSPSLTRILSAATFLNNCFAESCFGNFRPLRRLGSPLLNLYRIALFNSWRNMAADDGESALSGRVPANSHVVRRIGEYQLGQLSTHQRFEEYWRRPDCLRGDPVLIAPV